MEDPYPKVGDAHSLLQDAYVQGALPHVQNLPLTLILRGAHVPSFLSSTCLEHRTTLYRKLHAGQIGENLPLSLTHCTHTYTGSGHPEDIYPHVAG